MWNYNLRLVVKPHSVPNGISILGRSSIWTICCQIALAAYPGFDGDGQPPAINRWLHPCLALLQTGVAWPSILRWMPVVSYTTFSPSPLHPKGWKGCLFLWPFSGRFTPLGGFPAPGAIRRRALWSADFPRSRQRRTAIAQPAWGEFIIHAWRAHVNIKSHERWTFHEKTLK